MIAREKAKMKKLSIEMKPSMEEENKFREELQHELKNNPVFKQDLQIQKIEEKYQKRLKLIEKKITERKEVREEALKQFIKQKDKEIMMLFIDGSNPEDLQRSSIDKKSETRSPAMIAW